MSIGGIAMLLLVLAGCTLGLTFIIANSQLTAPIDDYDRTTPSFDNVTRGNATAVGQIGSTLSSYIVLIAGCLFVFVIIIFFAKLMVSIPHNSWGGRGGY